MVRCQAIRTSLWLTYRTAITAMLVHQRGRSQKPPSTQAERRKVRHQHLQVVPPSELNTGHCALLQERQ